MSDSQISPESEPQIQQDVQGDSNQVIGQAIDSIVIKNLTIYERVPKSSAPAAVTVIQPLTQQEYRQRQILLNKVREYWVKGVLGTSLHARVLIELGLQERLDLVPHPFSDITEFVEAPGQVLPEGTQTTDVFDRMVIGRTLLILGEPGSGKTVTLLKLAEDLITRTEQDFGQPIPVVFNLSSWTRKLQTIEEWLEQELLEKYKVSRALGKAWVETEALILLLDGLDEVKAEQRNACVKALNQFMQIHGTTELVICSRLQDYQLLAEPLTLRSAICIQPLTSRQINSFFEQAGMQLSTLKIILNKDEMLHNLATTPLILSIMSLAYQDCKPEEITLDGGTEEYRRRLFNTYIERMFQRRKTSQVYKKKESKDWLIWLAKPPIQI
jgi:predicted NACHT family NTPase